MRTRTGFGDPLTVLLRRRLGISERRALIGYAAFAALVVVAILLVHDPLGGRTQLVHRAKPVFNTLYRAGPMHPVAPQTGELQRIVGRRGTLRVTMTVRALRLPAYRGDVAGMFPIYAETRRVQLARSMPGFRLTDEGKARIGKAPAYELDFRYGSRSSGRDVFVVPLDRPGVRDGLLITLRQSHGTHANTAAQALVVAFRTAARSVKFGSDRSD